MRTSCRSMSSRRRPGCRSVATLAVAALAFLAAPSLYAQGPPDPERPDFDPSRHGLAADPLLNEYFGLTMYYPDGAIVTPTNYGEGLIITIQDDLAEPTWQIRIQQAVMRGLDNPTPAGVAQRLVRDLSRGGTDDLTILRNEPRTFGSRAGHELWARQANVIAGFLIADTGVERFTMFRVATTTADFEHLRPLFDASLSTVRLSTDLEMRAQREAEFEMGRKAIERLTPERLKTLLGTTQWFRIYEADSSGDWRRDREIGYVRLAIVEGMRGQVNASRSPEEFRGVERETGMLVAVDARYLEREPGPGAPPILADFQIRLWQAWDRSQETWLTRATYRQGEASRNESESGTREPPKLGYSKVNVIKDRHYEWVVQEPYLSQAEVYLLGHLLPRDGSVSGTMRFHAYETTHQGLETLPVRVDRWYPAPDGSGRWILESRPSPDQPGVTSIFDRQGNLVRREKPGNIITEPIDRQRLLEIWRAKGLPTGSER